MNKSLFVFAEGSREHRMWQTAMWSIVGLMVLLIPVLLEPFQVGKMNRAIIMAVAILGLNLVIGFGGQLALGHSAFMGLGAFITATMVQDELWDYWMVIPIVILAGR